MKISIGVIGGGAAGMMAAITAAKAGAAVTLFEGNDRLGKKILSTGNGKCNFSNLNMSMDAYSSENPEIVEGCLKRFDVYDTIYFFEQLGMLVKDKGGYLYPACDQAAVVSDLLRYEIESLQIQVITNAKVQSIQKGKKFMIETGTKKYGFDRVILACGSKAAPKTGSDGTGYDIAKMLGHRLVPVVPALTGLKCKENYFKAVSGVRADASITLCPDNNQKNTKKSYEAPEEKLSCRGELQLTDYGISGIPIFQLSRHANYFLRSQKELSVVIDFLPDITNEKWEEMTKIRRMLADETQSVEVFFTGILNKKLMMLFIKNNQLKADMPLKDADSIRIEGVFAMCKEWHVTVNGSNSFDQAQICAGGVSLEDLTENLESTIHPGLYFAGELLDVDGMCGGYNLQWAWSSGYVTGKAAASGEVYDQN